MIDQGRKRARGTTKRDGSALAFQRRPIFALCDLSLRSRDLRRSVSSTLHCSSSIRSGTRSELLLTSPPMTGLIGHHIQGTPMHMVESLEQRRLFSSDPIFELTSKGTLIVHGTADNDAVIGRLLQGKSN